MHQQSTAPTLTASPHATADVAESLGAGVPDERIAALREAIALPTSARGFLLFMLALALVTTGVVMQIVLSVQIRGYEVAIRDATAEARLIEQRNTELMWEISRATSVETVRRRALALGYRPIEAPRYLQRPAMTIAEANPIAKEMSIEFSTEMPAAADRSIGSGMAEAAQSGVSSFTIGDATAAQQTGDSVAEIDEQWTSGLVTRMRSGAAAMVRGWLAKTSGSSQ